MRDSETSSDDLVELITRAIEVTNDSTDPVEIFAVIHDVLAFQDLYKPAHRNILDATRNAARVSNEEAEFRAAFIMRAYRSEGYQIPFFDTSVTRNALTDVAKWARSRAKGGHAPLTPVRTLAWIARAIDSMFCQFHLNGSTLIDELYAFYDRLSYDGNLLPQNSKVRGLVLPEGKHTSYGDSLRQLFVNLVRVEHHIGSKIDYQIGPGLGFESAGRGLRFGVLVVVADKKEVIWERKSSGAGVRISPDFLDNVLSRTLIGLNWLAENGADIVVLPELVSHEALRHKIRSWMREAGSRRPALVVAGTEVISTDEEETQPNRAFVIGRLGLDLWHQDKANRFRFDPLLLERAQLCDIFGCDAIDEEGWSPSSVVVVRDIPGLGRCVTLVCEDYARDHPGQQVVKALGPDFVMVPVLDGPPKDSNWWTNNGFALTQDPGSTIGIANSFALMDRLDPPPGGWNASHIGRVIGPGPNYPRNINILTDEASNKPLAALWDLR